jgi:cell division septum initiation protein DivIVA
MDPIRELIAALDAARHALDAAVAENARLRQRIAVLEQSLAASQRAGMRISDESDPRFRLKATPCFG